MEKGATVRGIEEVKKCQEMNIVLLVSYKR